MSWPKFGAADELEVTSLRNDEEDPPVYDHLGCPSWR